MATQIPGVPSSLATYRATDGTNSSSDYNFSVGFYNNTAAPFPVDDLDYELLKQIEIGVLSTVFILALLGNGIVVGFLLLRRKKLSRMNLFIVHLSIADLAVAFFNILTQIIPLAINRKGYLFFPDFLCRLYPYAQLVPLYASSYMLVIIAVDRFYAICKPLSNYSWTKKRSYLMVFLTWLTSLALSCPQIVFFHRDDTKERCSDMFWSVWKDDPRPYQIYVITMMILMYLIPTILLAILYGTIVVTIWTNASFKNAAAKSERSDKVRKKNRNRNRARNANVVAPRTHSTRGTSKAKVKTVLMTFVVILTFILCWTPYWVSMVLWAFDGAYYESITAKAIVLLSALNSCSNPFIYLFFNFQIVLRSLPCRRRNRSHLRMGSESQSMTVSTKMNSSFSFNRGSMSLTALQTANSEGSIPGATADHKPAAELIAMRRYSPNGEIQLDYVPPLDNVPHVEPCNGDASKDHHVRFGGQYVADSRSGFGNTGYL